MFVCLFWVLVFFPLPSIDCYSRVIIYWIHTASGSSGSDDDLLDKVQEKWTWMVLGCTPVDDGVLANLPASFLNNEQTWALL